MLSSTVPSFRPFENQWNQTFKDLARFSRPGRPTRSLGFTNRPFQKEPFALSRTGGFRRFPPLGFHRGGMDNLAEFFGASMESFDFFQHPHFRPSSFPWRAVHISASPRSVNRFFKRIFYVLQTNRLARHSLPLRGTWKVSKRTFWSTVF